MGRPLMPHQRLIVDVFLEVQSEEAGDPEPGEWAFNDGTATMQRRGGKTAIQSPLVTHRARLVRGAQMFMTAQTRGKARRRWMDISNDLLRSPLRKDITRRVSLSHEELVWKDGGASLIPFAPNEDEMHSETPDLVLIDELWAFDAEQKRKIQAGYVPAFATSSGQALKMSTAGTDASVWLNEDRTAGRAAVEAGVTRGRFYAEWSLPDRIDGVRIKDMTDAALVAACVAHHPAVCHLEGCPGPRQKKPCPHGFTIRPSAIEAAFVELADRAEFTRAFGNRSAADLSALWTAIREATWRDQVDPGGIPTDAPVVFGVWVDEEGFDAAVSAAFRDDSADMHVEALKREDGVRWVRPWVDGLSTTPRTIAIPNVGAARDVADELEKAGHSVLRVSQADVAAAVSRHRQELAAGTWWHRQNTDATAAAAAVGLKRSGGGQTWDRPGDTISLVGSMSLSGWGWDHTEPEAAPVSFWMS